MNHFNWKSLAFYGTMIGSVLLIFKVVTAYGETQLKAAPNISGSYHLTAQNLPDCLKSDDLTLTIEQSGIYLFGNLSLTSQGNKQTNAHNPKIALDGKLREQKLSLSGKIDQLARCQQLATANSADLLQIQGSKEGKNLIGKMTWNSASPEVTFTAQLDESQTQQEEEKGH